LNWAAAAREWQGYSFDPGCARATAVAAIAVVESAADGWAQTPAEARNLRRTLTSIGFA
jgi:hypothetical protein